MRGRQVRRLGGVGLVHRHMRRRHGRAAPQGGPHGERVRPGGGGQGLRGEVLQRGRRVRAVRGLRVQLLGGLVGLLRGLQRRHAPGQACQEARPRQRGLVRGRAEGDLALPPRPERDGARALRCRLVGGLRAGPVGVLGRVQRHLRGGPEVQNPRGCSPAAQRREGLQRLPGRGGAVRQRELRRASRPGLPARGLERLGRLRFVQRAEDPVPQDQPVPPERRASLRADGPRGGRPVPS
mmetsp:Transcript_73824/g.192608  ORF Transcript_73824/g.192608 Transcript_73824/m.192608 type:complete len:238 (-) Transcript_73824:568-1281(-)